MTEQVYIGQSPAFLDLLKKTDKMARSDASILLRGETGVGKEMIAQRLHEKSPRRKKPFVAINCAAFPDTLIESELFGHVKGAFTTAHRTHDGLVTAAEGGTLFLDEIGEMDINLQAKLLRFIETGEFRKLGSTQVEKSNIRITTATHQNLHQMISKGFFREDLFYRISILTLDIPNLKERKTDIPLLAEYFLQQISKKEKKHFKGIEKEGLCILSQHSWPGNIRELQNMLYKTIVLNTGEILTTEMINSTLLPIKENTQNPFKNVITFQETPAPKPLWKVERTAIEEAIQYCDGNIPRAASLLEVSPSTLYRKRGQEIKIPAPS